MSIFDNLFGGGNIYKDWEDIATREEYNLAQAAAVTRKAAIRRMEDYLRSRGMIGGGGEVAGLLAEIEAPLRAKELELMGIHSKQKLAIKQQEEAERRAKISSLLKGLGITAGTLLSKDPAAGALYGDIAGELVSSAAVGSTPSGIPSDIASLVQLKAGEKAEKEQREVTQNLLNMLFPKKPKSTVSFGQIPDSTDPLEWYNRYRQRWMEKYGYTMPEEYSIY